MPMKDNKISKEEYIKDLLDDGDTDDFWVENEKNNFDEHRDKDNNGFLDFGEVKGRDKAIAQILHLGFRLDCSGRIGPCKIGG